MAAADRLSDLPDDLLAHILSFSPTREAARTTLLSRRWRRPLWLHAPVLSLNFDSRFYPASRPWWRSQTADHALAFHRSAYPAGPIKIALVMQDKPILLSNVLNCFREDGVRELRVDCLKPARPPYLGNVWPIGTLRILDLAGCDLPTTPSSWSFPGLEALRLWRCARCQLYLLPLINAAPKLSDLRLQSLSFSDSLRLHCPTVTFLVMTNCNVDGADEAIIEVDAPRLRRLRYRYTRINTSVYLASPAPPGLELVNLEVHSAAHLRTMLRSVSGAAVRVLKLTVYSIADIDEVVDGMMFPNLEHLQIEQVCGCLDNHGAAATAMVNMLRICPVVRELRLKFSWRKYLHESPDVDAELMARLDLTSDYCGGSLDGDGDDGCCEVPDGFRCGCSLASLRNVVVQLEAEQQKLTCFQVQLVNFLVRNSMLLEEVRIDGGNHHDDSSCEVARWTSLGRRSCRPCSCAPATAAAAGSSASPPVPSMSSFPPLRPRRLAVPLAPLLLPAPPRRPSCPPSTRSPPPRAHRRSAALASHTCKTRSHR